MAAAIPRTMNVCANFQAQGTFGAPVIGNAVQAVAQMSADVGVNTALGLLQGRKLNGPVEIGMEAGAEPGLAHEHYLQIPHCMFKPTIFNTVADAANNIASIPIINPATIYIIDQQFWVFDGNELVRVTFDSQEAHTEDDWNRFAMVNWDILGGATDALNTQFLALRMACIMLGFGTCRKTNEFTVVADPVITAAAPIPANVQAAVREVLQNHNSILTHAFNAVTARGVNWIQRKHATGGTTLSGLIQKVCIQMGIYDQNADVNARMARTSLIHRHIHAAGPHVVASRIMAHDSAWAAFDPRVYFINAPAVLPSFRTRVNGISVHGTALIRDCAQIAARAVRSNMIIAFQHLDQAAALGQANAQCIQEGLRVCESQGWFYEGHPLGRTGIQFNQKDPLIFDFMVECATYITYGTIGGTLSQAPSVSSLLQSNQRQERITMFQHLRDLFCGSDVTAQVAMMIFLGRRAGQASVAQYNIMATTAGERQANLVNFNNIMNQIGTTFGVAYAPLMQADLPSNPQTVALIAEARALMNP